MTMRKINARDMLFEVEAALSGTWYPIANINTFSHNPAENEETTETTVYESEGQYEGEKMQVGASLQIEGIATYDDITGTQDVGQARCETLHGQLGTASLGRIRFRHMSQTNWKLWTGIFSLGEQGGGNNDKSSWSCTVTRSGASTLVSAT